MREGWGIKKLGDIADLKRGLTYSKGDEVPFSSKRVLRSNNIDLESSKLDLTELKYLREDFVIPEDRKVKKNSIFICMSNGSKQHVGKVAFIDEDIDYAFGGFMGLIVPKEVIAPKYVFYSCLSPAYRLFLSSIGNGIGITNLRFTDLANFTLPVPPVQEQEKIVAELDCLSGIIEKKKQQLKELDNLAQSIFYNMFGDPITNEKGWEMKQIGSFSTCIAGATPSTKYSEYWENGTIPWLSSGEVGNGRIYDTEKKITQVGYDSCSTRLIPAHTLVIAMAGQGKTRGTAGVAEIPLCTNQSICSVIPDEKVVLVDYLYYLMKMMYKYLRSISNGDGGRGGLNLKLIGGFQVIVPPLDVQNDFAQKIEAIEKQKELIKKSIQETETLFNSRMDYWFN